MALFAVSECSIRYGAEVKPYATDLLVSLLLLNLALRWLHRAGHVRSLWTLALVAPLAIAVSLPSIFVIATIAFVGVFQVLARRESRLIIAFGSFLAQPDSRSSQWLCWANIKSRRITVPIFWSFGLRHFRPLGVTPKR